MKVTALAGGTGGAKLLVGLQRVFRDLTAIVNTGDDALIYGVHVAPDVDMVTYWLAGLADLDRGWGLEGDTFNAVEAFRALGEEAWFNLGDKDLATCLLRTRLLRDGATLSAVTDHIRQALGVPTRIFPMSDDPVRTHIHTSDGRDLEFQEYFVKEQTRPEVTGVSFRGAEDAKPAPGVIEAIAAADHVVVCPSNPVVSIGPILAVPGIEEALVRHPSVVAVTPIVEGRALKGPADRLLRAAGAEVSASGVARMYARWANRFVVDDNDREEGLRLQRSGIETVVLDTIMVDHDAAERLARALF
jgi:LPPG:FO 2-phospho-L-lactate transferase